VKIFLQGATSTYNPPIFHVLIAASLNIYSKIVGTYVRLKINKKTYERRRHQAKRTEIRREKEGETMREYNNKEREREKRQTTQN
jgi:hypothetical protein